MRKYGSLCTLGVLLIAVAVQVGCGSDGQQAARGKPVNRSDVVGTWRQDPANAAAMALPATQGHLRELVINDDGTYKMTVCDTSGKPVEPANSVEGKYEVKGTEIYFTATTTNLDQNHEGWGPMRYIKMGLKSKGHDSDFLETRDDNSARTHYLKVAK